MTLLQQISLMDSDVPEKLRKLHSKIPLLFSLTSFQAFSLKPSMHPSLLSSPVAAPSVPSFHVLEIQEIAEGNVTSNNPKSVLLL
jgi:hypothetical protein